MSTPLSHPETASPTDGGRSRKRLRLALLVGLAAVILFLVYRYVFYGSVIRAIEACQEQGILPGGRLSFGDCSSLAYRPVADGLVLPAVLTAVTIVVAFVVYLLVKLIRKRLLHTYSSYTPE